MIKTGIFSGSFNPVHIGHLALANYLCEFAGFDEIWFVVTPNNPLKDASLLIADNLRLEMVKIAVAGYPKFHASDFEFSLPKPSYTINTLRALKKEHPERDFNLIIGSDNWQIFPRWKESETILNEFGVTIYPRKEYRCENLSALPHGATFIDAPVFDISSTFIRDALSAGKDVRFLLPKGVYEFWKEYCALP